MRQGKQVAALTCLTHDSGVIGTEDSDLMGKSLVEDMGGLWIGLFIKGSLSEEQFSVSQN